MNLLLLVCALGAPPEIKIVGPDSLVYSDRNGATAIISASCTDSKAVRWLVMNPVLPKGTVVNEFLDKRGNDVLVITGLRQGTYYFNYNAVNDKHEYLTITHQLVVQEDQPPKPDPKPDPKPGPGPKPDPDPDPKPPGDQKFFITVFERPDSRTPDMAKLLTSKSLKDTLAGRGHIYNLFSIDDTVDEEKNLVSDINAVGLPCVIVQDKSGNVVHKFKLPADEAGFVAEIKKKGG